MYMCVRATTKNLHSNPPYYCKIKPEHRSPVDLREAQAELDV